MYILGLNAYHGDSSACILRDGQLVAAIEEERIRRVKHWAGLPTAAIKFCLAQAGIALDQVAHIAIGRDPRAHFGRKLLFLLRHPPRPRTIVDRARNLAKVGGLATALGAAFNIPADKLAGKIKHVEHHRAHISSAFFVSPFEHAAALSLDGMGDFTSTMWGVGHKNSLYIDGAVHYPHSLGFAYLRYFTHHKAGVQMSWNGGEPVIGQMFSKELERLLGPARESEEPLTEHHKDIAASVQALYEEHLFRILDHLHKTTKLDALVFAGGAAQNSLANGRILRNSAFKKIYIPPAGHDAGTAVGAAFSVWHEIFGKPRAFVMESPFWGPEYDAAACEAALKEKNLRFSKLDDTELFRRTAELIAQGKIVGWFQGRTEWGPRALGNRSILANPAFPQMKETLNTKIKKREPFRPFAPSILEENVGEYFEAQQPVPFMEKVYVVRPEMRAKIPAVVHVDGTGRLQSVSRRTNPRYYYLIQEVGKLTGVPVVLNTSFNENEPIVNRPEEAVACYLRTKMDALVLGNHLVIRND
jgi:carbamoyltransferase